MAISSLALASLFMATAPSAAPGETTSNWRVTLRVDPIRDREEGSAWLFSVDGKSRLSVACNGLDDRTLSMQFIPRGVLGSQARQVIVRVGSGEPIPTYSWLYVRPGAYTTNPNLLAAIFSQISDDTQRIVIRAYDYQNQPLDGVFMSTGGRSQISKIEKLCEAEVPSQ